MDKNGNVVKLEEVFGNHEFTHPIDMDFGPDGSAYFLEYGPVWWGQSPSAKLSRIHYLEGNRAPMVHLRASAYAGAVPMVVSLSGYHSYDPEGDDLAYEWKLEGNKVISRHRSTVLSINQPGIYHPRLTVTDRYGKSSTGSVQIIAGNTAPKITTTNAAGRMLYSQKPNTFVIDIQDKEDLSIDSSSVYTRLLFFPNAYQKEVYVQKAGQIEQITDYDLLSNPLFAQTDCKACHLMYKKSVGPSFLSIRERYWQDSDALDKLIQKIILGGMGNWGSYIMSAHPQLKVEDVWDMVKMILSLDTQAIAWKHPLQKVDYRMHEPSAALAGFYLLESIYQDQGVEGKVRLTGRGFESLQSASKIYFNSASKFYRTNKNFTDKSTSEIYVGSMTHGSYLGYESLNAQYMKEIKIALNSKGAFGYLEIRADSPKGHCLEK